MRVNLLCLHMFTYMHTQTKTDIKNMLPNVYCIENKMLVHHGLREKHILTNERLETNILALKMTEQNILARLKNLYES